MSFEESIVWLRGEARRAAAGCIIQSHNGISLYTPDGSAHYQALWTRDFFYLLEGAPDAVPLDKAEACFQYLLNGQREDGAMPDRVQADGLAVYMPGPAGNGIGPLPANDNPAFMVKIAALLCDRKADFTLYHQSREKLVKGLKSPLKSSDGILWIDPQHPHSSYGFFDTIMLTGEVFFSSLLQWEAYRLMADMDQKIGLPESSQSCQQQAANLKKALQKFWHPEVGMFYAATVDCRQIDIWGSLYAAYCGLADEAQTAAIKDYLLKNQAHLMQHGQLRHCAPGEYWQRSLTPKDKYQNGGFWATPFGWWFVLMHRDHPQLAKEKFIELVQSFRGNGINEWILGDKKAVPDYVASAWQPLAGLARCGY